MSGHRPSHAPPAARSSDTAVAPPGPMTTPDSHRRATLLVTAVDELFGSHRVACSRNNRTYSRWPSSVSTQNKSVAKMPCAGANQELSPGRAIAARCGVDAGSLENRPPRAGRHRITKPRKFTPDAPVTPAGVLRGQPQDQPAQLGCRATSCDATARWGPALLDQVSVPSHDRGGGDDPRQLAGRGQQPSQCREHRSIHPRQPRPPDLATEHGDLMT